MSFGPNSIRGGGAAGDDRPAPIDYRLARNALVAEFKRGRLGRPDVCDAHPELIRAAREVGRPTAEPCPICEAAQLVLVSYAFGAKLPAHGRCLTSARETTALARRAAPSACYVVEVCPECSWNHLARTFTLGGRPASTS